MCYTCGCRLPYDDHGDPRNLVESAFVRGGRTKAIKNAGRARAKVNTLDLLLEERRRGQLAKPRKSYAPKERKAT